MKIQLNHEKIAISKKEKYKEAKMDSKLKKTQRERLYKFFQ